MIVRFRIWILGCTLILLAQAGIASQNQRRQIDQKAMASDWRRFRERLRRVILAVTAVAIGSLSDACLPVPHNEYRAPAITGVVRSGDLPVADAELQLTADYTREVSTARTDAKGNFAVAPLRDFRFVTVLLGDPSYAYKLQIIAAGKKFQGFAAGRIGFAPKKIELVCDLSKADQTTREDGTRGNCSIKSP